MTALFSYRLRRRVGDLLARRGRPLAAAALVWLAWALFSLLLMRAWQTAGWQLSLISLGALSAAGVAYGALWLRRDIRRERSIENRRLLDLVWLNSQLQPRRPLPSWVGGMARVDLLAALLTVIRAEKPSRVLELGSGLSTLTIAYGLQAQGFGTLFSLEDVPAHAANTRRLLAEHGLTDYAIVLDAPLRPIQLDGESRGWYALRDLPVAAPIDLLLIDGPAGYLESSARYPALPMLRDYLADDAIVVVDDIDRPSERESLRRWLADFPELAHDESLSGAGFAVLRLARSQDRVRA